jgi:hypothetical protein
MVFVLHNMPGAKKRALASTITDFGGAVSQMVTNKVTHVVATQQDITAKGVAMQAFAKRKLAVVTEQFVLDRTRGQKRRPKSQPAAAVTAQPSGTESVAPLVCAPI